MLLPRLGHVARLENEGSLTSTDDPAEMERLQDDSDDYMLMLEFLC